MKTVLIDLQHAVADPLPADDDFQRWAEAALTLVDVDCELCIRIVDVAESQQLNHQYRQKDYPTNVLSFPFDAPIALEPRLLGDLVMCAPVVKKEASEQGKPEQHHWAHLTIHGCLHLLGYDHLNDEEAEEMEALEIQILQTLDIANPYLEPRL
ncbi:metal-dependent hydrolase [Methylophaga frappieri]|uniref:Endoribonuclease YbeY n=1 Tax=Methylophaga frappieri (strain ATCC BAA-2434 / DSM 25690 / JAM7) TaxID=754477 RepID=I1YJ45_METFJ|nr:rRNA maturation RNase YbeY [Methylophaga frappieri]AFJ02938.1 metal-dependent hydrolase [Methylophaga frappieri]